MYFLCLNWQACPRHIIIIWDLCHQVSYICVDNDSGQPSIIDLNFFDYCNNAYKWITTVELSHLLNIPHDKVVQSVIYQCFAWRYLPCYRRRQYRLTVSDLWEHYENRAKVMKCLPLLCLKIKIENCSDGLQGSPWTTRLKNKYKYHHWNSWRRVTCLDRITLTHFDARITFKVELKLDSLRIY